MLCVRRKKSKSSSDGRATDATTARRNQPENYELEAGVTGVTSGDQNGGLITAENATNPTTEYANDSQGMYDDAVTVALSDTGNPAQVSQKKDPKSRTPVQYTQVNKKRDARIAQHGKGAPGNEGGGKVGKGNAGAMQEDIVDYYNVDSAGIGDKELYANVTTPASAPLASSSSSSPTTAAAAATEAGQTREPICTSINDFTLIDNTIYNE